MDCCFPSSCHWKPQSLPCIIYTNRCPVPDVRFHYPPPTTVQGGRPSARPTHQDPQTLLSSGVPAKNVTATRQGTDRLTSSLVRKQILVFYRLSGSFYLLLRLLLLLKCRIDCDSGVNRSEAQLNQYDAIKGRKCPSVKWFSPFQHPPTNTTSGSFPRC